MRASMLLFFGATLLVPGSVWADESDPIAVEVVAEGLDSESDRDDPASLLPSEGGAEAAEAPTAEIIPPVFEETPVETAAGDEGLLPTGDPEAAAVSPQPAESVRVQLGALGYDSEGRPGRIHVVVSGDTLWDISEAYLGTPWIWPSIWKDNREIENPHLIQPGEHIWITPTEMRRVTMAEAVLLTSGSPAAPEVVEMGDSGVMPPAEVPVALETAPAPPVTRLVNSREGVGLISADALRSSASIVDAVTPRLMLVQGDSVFIGLGRNDTQVGDEFTVFRERDRVLDPDTGRLLGYHIDILGWVRVSEAYAETALVAIRESSAPMERGDRLIPRELIPQDIEIAPSPTGVEGRLSYFARNRTMMAHVDYVYLNRGTVDGLEVGSPLEVFRRDYLENETARNALVRVPGRVVAQLLVVKAEAKTSVATVTHTSTELELGDLFRGATN